MNRLILTAVSAAVILAAGCSTPTPPPPHAANPPDRDVASTPVTTVDAARPAEPVVAAAVEAESRADRARHEHAAGSAPARELAKMSIHPGAAAPHADAYAHLRAPSAPVDRETYAQFDDSGVKRAAEHPVSTFSIDVDTGAYTNVRRFLNAGRLPPRDAVRVEEFINYFDHAHPAPDSRERPFRVTTEVAPTPWNPRTHLLMVGIKGVELEARALPPANLVFLIDVSGSMHAPDKLDLLKSSLRMLVQELRPQDRVALVVYAGGTGVALEPTSGADKARILAALDGLRAGGSTHGAAGIRLAYAMAEQGYVAGGLNRILLATDGDFNVGTTNFEALKALVEEKRRSGVSLTTLGFGTGNYNDRLMEQLADAGNGQYAYIDSLKEGHRVLVRQQAGTLATIAKDVKIQVEFNPALVSEYRLLGYENRALAREDFANDKVDAGDIGAGHTVTALYEVALAGSGGARIEPLRYGAAPVAADHAGELAHVRLRWKAPEGGASRLIEFPVERAAVRAEAGETLRFAAAVAGFGQLLRGGRYMEAFGYGDVKRLAQGARGADPDGWRGEFLTLVDMAQALSTAARN